MGKGFGTTALIFGIISIPIAVVVAPIISILAALGGILAPPLILADFFTVLGWIMIGIAIIFGIIGIAADDSKGRGIAGLILGIISLIVAIIMRTFFAEVLALIFGG